MCKVVEYPFDTIKVLQQTGGTRYSGAIDCARQTIGGAGAMSLYQGLSAPLLGSMAECSALFVTYGFLKKLLKVDEDSATLSNPVPFWKFVVSGGGAGVASTCILTPVELVKCRLQAQLNTTASIAGSASVVQYKGPIDCVVRTIRTEGITGLWRGNLSTLMREVPGNMAWFGVYELTLMMIQRFRGDERKSDVPLYWSAFSGSCAGVAYWAVPFPADTVKSKIQTDSRFRGASFLNVLRHVVKEDGVAGLYRGCAITCFRAVPSHALIFYFYEVANRFLLRF